MGETCPNPHCEGGWVERLSGGEPGPCFCCRRHVAVVKRREDDHTSTVDGAAGAEEWYGGHRGPPFHAMPEPDRPDWQDAS